MRIRGGDGRCHRGDRRDGRAWDDTRTADNLSDREASGRGDRDIVLAVIAAGGGKGGRRTREQVRRRGGVLEVEGERALVDDRATREGVLAENREVTRARLDQRTGTGNQGGRGDGDVTVGVDLNGAVAGEDDVQATLSGGINAREREVSEGVEVMEDTRARGREVQVTDRGRAGVATGAGDGADKKVARAEVVVGDAQRSHRHGLITSKHEGPEAAHAPLLIDRSRVDTAIRGGRGLRIRQTEDRRVDEAAVEGERGGGTGGSATSIIQAHAIVGRPDIVRRARQVQRADAAGTARGHVSNHQ